MGRVPHTNMWSSSVSICGFLVWSSFGTVSSILFGHVNFTNQLPLETINNFIARSKLHCVATCGTYPLCVGVYYIRNSSECVLFQTQTQCGDPWITPQPIDIILKPQVDVFELLVFRVSAGTGQKVYDPWVDNAYLSGCEVAVLDMNHTINSTYKHTMVKYWTDMKIKQVRVTLWKDGAAAVWLWFDAENTNHLDWFSHDRLQNSSFTDLISDSSAEVSIKGYKGVRRFYLKKSHGLCPFDRGWMFFKDWSNPFPCEWEKQAPYPAFVYSESNQVVTWDNHKDAIGLADDLLISLIFEV